jgi:hypothetical protein
MVRERRGPTPQLRLSESRRPEAQGWLRRFTVEAERAGDYVELYKSLGDAVGVEPVTSDLLADAECATCLLDACDRYVVIYTRPADS